MDPVPDPLVDLVDDSRLQAAALERTQRRLLAEADGDEATLLGTLGELAERRVTLHLDTVAGHRARAHVRAIAGDHVVLEGPHGRSLVALRAISAVRVDRDVRVRVGGAGRGGAPVAGTFAEALRPLRDERADVLVVVLGAPAVRGRVTDVGSDVVGVDSDAREHVVVPLRAVVAVVADPA